MHELRINQRLQLKNHGPLAPCMWVYALSESCTP
jgi:hypothetical protein